MEKFLADEDIFVVYDKKNGISRGRSGSLVPSLSNDTPFFNDSISDNPQNSNLSDEKISDSLRSVGERMKPGQGIKKIAGAENPLAGAWYDSGAADAVESADGKEVKM